MKRHTAPSVFFATAFVSFGLLLTSSFANSEKKVDCKVVGETLARAIQESPEKVLVMVEDAVITNESCVCQIIQVAIHASNAGPELVKQIILTASNVAPEMSASIRECIGEATPVAEGEGDKQVVDVYGEGDEDGGKSVSTVYDDGGKSVSTVYDDGGKSPQMVLPAENINPDDDMAMPNDDFSFEPSNPFSGMVLPPAPTNSGFSYPDNPDPPTDWDPISNAVATRNSR